MYDVNWDYIQEIMKRYVTVANQEFGLIITTAEQEEVTNKILEHYIDHCTEYRVFVNSTDPFKFTAWMGLFFYHDIKKKSAKRQQYLVIAVAMMIKFLKDNNRNIDIKFAQKLLKMTIYDKDTNKDYLAIGKNGLYMAFRSANMVKIDENI